MPTNRLYDTWKCRIMELRPEQRMTQVRNFVWLMVGIFQSRSVCLSRIAGKIPGPAKLLSTTRRLSRLLDNPAIRVREWYEPIARKWLETQMRNLGEIRLIVDGTKIGFGHQLLIVSLAYRKRAIPLAWTWVQHVRGHSSASKHLALLAYVRKLIPQKAAVFLVGDCEFGAVAILRQLDQWHWFYVLRQKRDTGVWFDERNGWQTFGSFIHKPGQSIWLGGGCLTAKEIYPVNLLVHWKAGEKEPWCLATNLPDLGMALQYYRRRMWIEEMFGDMKKHGFDLERTMLRHFDRLSRLTLAVALLYVWLFSCGTRIVRNGMRDLVDRNDRRDLSIFQIGLRFIERCVINAQCFSIVLYSYR
jgi:Transposase DDE domain